MTRVLIDTADTRGLAQTFVRVGDTDIPLTRLLAHYGDLCDAIGKRHDVASATGLSDAEGEQIWDDYQALLPVIRQLWDAQAAAAVDTPAT